jgi:hypothetical protein
VFEKILALIWHDVKNDKLKWWPSL